MAIRKQVLTAKGPVTVAVSGKRLSVTVPAPATVAWNGRSAGSHDFE